MVDPASVGRAWTSTATVGILSGFCGAYCDIRAFRLVRGERTIMKRALEGEDIGGVAESRLWVCTISKPLVRLPDIMPGGASHAVGL